MHWQDHMFSDDWWEMGYGSSLTYLRAWTPPPSTRDSYFCLRASNSRKTCELGNDLIGEREIILAHGHVYTRGIWSNPLAFINFSFTFFQPHVFFSFLTLCKWEADWIWCLLLLLSNIFWWVVCSPASLSPPPQACTLLFHMFNLTHKVHILGDQFPDSTEDYTMGHWATRQEFMMIKYKGPQIFPNRKPEMDDFGSWAMPYLNYPFSTRSMCITLP